MSNLPRIQQAVRWRFAGDGIQLIASLWWLGYVAPSEQHPGKWWWKSVVTEVDAQSGYTDSSDEAIDKVLHFTTLDKNYEYLLPDVSVPREMVKTLIRAQGLKAARALRGFDPVI
jgi:hypothetical protein